MDKLCINKESENKETSDEINKDVSSAKNDKWKYDNKYLAFGFSWITEEDCPIPICIVYDEKLWMVPWFLINYNNLSFSKYPKLSTKSSAYLKRLLDSKQK